jgi:hypothetical protein
LGVEDVARKGTEASTVGNLGKQYRFRSTYIHGLAVHATLQLLIVDKDVLQTGNNIDPERGAADKILLDVLIRVGDFVIDEIASAPRIGALVV